MRAVRTSRLAEESFDQWAQVAANLDSWPPLRVYLPRRSESHQGAAGPQISDMLEESFVVGDGVGSADGLGVGVGPLSYRTLMSGFLSEAVAVLNAVWPEITKEVGEMSQLNVAG